MLILPVHIHNVNSIYGVEVRHRTDNKIIVVVSDTLDNIGIPLPAAWPELADIVCQKLLLNPNQTIFIEYFADKYSLMGFQCVGNEIEVAWHYLTLEELEVYGGAIQDVVGD